MWLEEYVKLLRREVTSLVILTQSFHFSEPCRLVQCLQNILSILLLMIFVVISTGGRYFCLTKMVFPSFLPRLHLQSEGFCYRCCPYWLQCCVFWRVLSPGVSRVHYLSGPPHQWIRNAHSCHCHQVVGSRAARSSSWIALLTSQSFRHNLQLTVLCSATFTNSGCCFLCTTFT